jgi:radical SAM superfamily enzyme YgiQ (UPF0313 family)
MARIFFCQRFVYSYFGVMSISAVLKKSGHSTELVLESDVDKAVSEILRSDPDVVMFSTLTATGDFEWSLEVAKGIKKENKSILTVFGGLHPTLFPEDTIANPEVDVICLGEWEFSALELCDRLERNEGLFDVAGLWVKVDGGIVRNPQRTLEENIDILPFPDRDLYQKYGYFNRLDSIDVMAGRGCPFSCSYCMNPVLKKLLGGKGKFVRKHSPAYVIRELEEVINKFKPKSFTFVDELFAVDKEWIRDFCGIYRERIGLPFTCNITPGTVDDECLSWLAAAGTTTVCMGLETGNEKVRRGLLNKPVSNPHFEATAQRLHFHGIKFLTSNIVGLPGETVEEAFKTVEFNRKIKTDFVYFSIFQPYPGLPLTEKLQRDGNLGPIRSSDFCSTFFKSSILKQDNINQLVNLHKFFYVVFRFPWLKPLIQFLIRFPPNKLFEQIFILSYAWLALTCFRRHPFQLFAMGRGNAKIFFGDRGAP